MNVGGFGTTQAFSEFVLQFSVLSFCSSERKKEKKKKWTGVVSNNNSCDSVVVICYTELI
jgi:hypothetical protein